MDISVVSEGTTIEDPDVSFVMTGFAMQGAEFDKEDSSIKLSQSLGSALPSVVLKWVKKDKATLEAENEVKIQIPVYMTRTRRNLVASFNIPTQGEQQYVWYQRGVAFFAWFQT